MTTVFVFAAGSGDDAGTKRFVHVSRFPTDEGFVNLHAVGEFAAALVLLAKNQFVEA